MESHSLVESDGVWEQGVPQERITVWKRSKAGYLSEVTKIFSRLDKVLQDYHFTSEVTELSRRLKDQWARYCFVYSEIMSHLPEDSGRANERDRFNDQTRAYERYSFLIEQFLTRAEVESGGAGSRALLAQEPGISIERVSFPRDAQSSVLTGSRKSRRSRRSSSHGSRSRENAAVESVLAKAKLTQLKKAKERKLKQQLLLLENEIADAEDKADLAQIRTHFYEHLDSDKGSEGSEEVPIIDDPSTKPVDLEKVVQYSDPQAKENLEPFIPESCLKEVQQRIIVPEQRLLEEVPRSTLDPRAPPFPQPN